MQLHFFHRGELCAVVFLLLRLLHGRVPAQEAAVHHAATGLQTYPQLVPAATIRAFDEDRIPLHIQVHLNYQVSTSSQLHRQE